MNDSQGKDKPRGQRPAGGRPAGAPHSGARPARGGKPDEQRLWTLSLIHISEPTRPY